MSELRWNPLLGEWVATATQRQERTFLPPKDYCPLCPTLPGGFSTEVPEADYDIAVFENRFPSLRKDPENPTVANSELYPVKPAQGICEVVLYSPNHKSSLAQEPVEQIYKLVRVWTDRFRALSLLDFVKYVFIFENKGEAIGVTLHHPHGQIYAYPVLPPVPARMQELATQHYAKCGRGILQDMIEDERRDGRRIVYEGTDALAFVPVCARYPYEVWVAPIRPVQDFTALSSTQRADLARALKTVLLKYDGLWQRPFPYLMAWYQAPTDGQAHPESHLQAQFFPPYRTRDRLKYLAGTEIAAGFFAMDALPEDKARELQQVEVTLR